MTDHPFSRLTPDFIINAIEAHGFPCDGRYLTLNSYENRVYQVGIDDGQPIIVKFYRPDRWSEAQILEEHEFGYELAQHDIPVVTPLRLDEARSLSQYDGFYLAVFERRGGHAPELDHGDNLSVMGRLLGRMHAIGARIPYQHRPGINLQSYGNESATFISEHFIPAELAVAYRSLCDDLLAIMQHRLDETGPVQAIRVHGDCHAGNLLWRDDAPHFVDFDDSRMAPAIQDIWMLLSGSHEQQARQLGQILDAYQQFYDFDFKQLKLIEVFRTLRIMYYSAWLARRWQDPAFPHNFPWFDSIRYWEQHILELREQLAALQQTPVQPA